jgi:hypothetical protein
LCKKREKGRLGKKFPRVILVFLFSPCLRVPSPLRVALRGGSTMQMQMQMQSRLYDAPAQRWGCIAGCSSVSSVDSSLLFKSAELKVARVSADSPLISTAAGLRANQVGCRSPYLVLESSVSFFVDGLSSWKWRCLLPQRQKSCYRRGRRRVPLFPGRPGVKCSSSLESKENSSFNQS